MRIRLGKIVSFIKREINISLTIVPRNWSSKFEIQSDFSTSGVWLFGEGTCESIQQNKILR